MIRLVLVDLDGTLVRAGNRVHPHSWVAIERAQRSGVRVAVCTGRPCSGHARRYAKRIDPDAPHIFDSGAVLCGVDGVLQHVEPLPRPSYERLVGIAREHGKALEAYSATACFVERPDDFTRAHAKLIDLLVEERELLGLTDQIVRVQWILPWAIWPQFEALTASDAALQISVATQPDIVETCFSSVTARGVSKASAAARLAAFHGLSLDEVAMVGDGDNDLDVIEAVGLGIAMGNGTAAVRAAADVVVGSVDHGGLAEAIDLALMH